MVLRNTQYVVQIVNRQSSIVKSASRRPYGQRQSSIVNRVIVNRQSSIE
ncbi:MAG: hypothetical protein MUD01_06060 [Chloroflexaceae bacterium]|nr:hypothetical protein [Chloroflexaceae bacterium]